MGQFQVGVKAGVGPVVKVLNNDVDDPFTVPNTAYGKWIFNSETSKYGYVAGSYQWDLAGSDLTWGPTAGLAVNHYFPTGVSSTSPFKVVTSKWVSTPGDTRYELMIEINTAWAGHSDLLSKHWFGEVIFFSTPPSAGANLAQRRNNVNAANPISNLWQFVYTAAGAGAWGSEQEVKKPDMRRDLLLAAPIPNGDVWYRLRLFVTDMPADDAAYLTNGTPVAGQRVLDVDFDQGILRAARPGFATDTGTSEQMILSDDRIPMKIAGTGLVTNIAAGATALVTPNYPITPTALVLYQINDVGEPLFVPPRPKTLSTTNLVTHRVIFSGGVWKVEFTNRTADPIDLRYIIMADDAEEPTAGTGTVMQVEPGILRFIRPGAAASPSSRDVILDSRTVSLPIVAEGFLDHTNRVASDIGVYGTHVIQVNFANDGTWKPFVMATARIRQIGAPNAIAWRDLYNRWLSYTSPDRNSALAFTCRLTDTSAKFYGYVGGNPNVVNRLGSGVINYNEWDFYGVRYYIFAIPLSL